MEITVIGKDEIIPGVDTPIVADDLGKVTRTVEAGVVSQIAQSRIQRQRQTLTQIFGEEKVKRADPIYPPGSVVNDTGVSNFKEFRQDLERLPNGDIACFDTLKEILKEGRAETELDASFIEPGPQPGTVIVNGSPYRFTPKAMGHLFSLINAPQYAAAHAPYASAAVLAQMLNDYAPREERRLVAAFRKMGVRGADADFPTIYRVASERYTPFDADKVLVTLLHTCPELLQSWKGQVRYDGDRLVIDFLSMPDTVVDLAAGDVFKIGIRFRANDVREGSIIVELMVWRNMCLNLIVIGEMSTEMMNLRHAGAMEDIFTMISSAMPKGELAFADFRHAWGNARSERIITSELPADKFMEGLAHSKILSLPGDTGVVKSALIDAWLKEPGYDRASVVNAVTRSVHENFKWKDEFASGKVEAEAGKMLTDRYLVSKVEAALAKAQSTKKAVKQLTA